MRAHRTKREKRKARERRRKYRLRLQEQREELAHLDRFDPSAAAVLRQHLQNRYKTELRKRVYRLDAEQAWPLADALKAELNLDLRPWLVRLLENVMQQMRGGKR